MGATNVLKAPHVFSYTCIRLLFYVGCLFVVADTTHICSSSRAERERERERQKQRERTILRETGMLEEESNKMNRVDPQVQTNNLKHSITSLRNSVDMVLTRGDVLKLGVETLLFPLAFSFSLL
jgi:hypothetical protein